MNIIVRTCHVFWDYPHISIPYTFDIQSRSLQKGNFKDAECYKIKKTTSEKKNSIHLENSFKDIFYIKQSDLKKVFQSIFERFLFFYPQAENLHKPLLRSIGKKTTVLELKNKLILSIELALCKSKIAELLSRDTISEVDKQTIPYLAGLLKGDFSSSRKLDLNRYRRKLYKTHKESLQSQVVLCDYLRRQENAFKVSLACAHKGSVISKTYSALRLLFRKTPISLAYKDDSSKVLLFPKLNIALKKHPKKLREEVHLYQQLLCFDMPQARVPSMSFQRLNPLRLGIPLLSPKIQRRAHDFSEHITTLYKDRITFEDTKELFTTFSKNIKKETVGIRSFTFLEKYKDQLFTLHQNDTCSTIDFQTVKGMYLRGKIEPWDLLADEESTRTKQEPPCLEYHIRTQTLLGRLLTLNESKHHLSLFLVPAPKKDPQKKYEDLEKKCIELFQGLTLEPKKSSIKELQFTLLTNDLPQSTKVRIKKEKPSSFAKLSHTRNKDIWKAITAPHKIMTTEPFIKLKDGRIKILRRVEAYEFIRNMISIHKAARKAKNFFQKAISNLTVEAVFFSVLCAELQHLDLHGNNIGIRLANCEAVTHLKNFSFHFTKEGRQVPLEKIMPFALKEKISKLYLTSFDGTTRKASIEELDDIHELAQRGRWEFVVIDEGMILQESNHWQYESLRQKDLRYKSGHIIPHRSVLYASYLKDLPFTQEVVSLLYKRLKVTKEVSDWIFRKDAPIYKYLPQSAIDIVSEHVIRHLQKDVFSLSHWRRFFDKGKKVAIEKGEKTAKPGDNLRWIQDRFCTSLADLSEHYNLWKFLQKTLQESNFFRPHKVTVHDTWKSIASLYNFDEQDLLELNPNVVTLTPGTKITVQPNLCKKASSSLKARKKIAAQLFPRMTFLQQKAYFDRRNAQKEYLETYQKLTEKSHHEKDFTSFLSALIENVAIPLSTSERKRFSRHLLQKESEIENLFLLKIELEKKLMPTYGNLVKCMYPHVADVTELAEIAVNHCKEFSSFHNMPYGAENLIGLYTHPIEDIIDAVKKAFPHGPECDLANHLEQTLQSEQDDVLKTAYFGKWIEEFSEDKSKNDEKK